MATIGDLRRWDAAALDAAALDLAEQGRRLVAIGDRLSAQVAPPGWTGDAAAAAGETTQGLVLQVNEGAADVAMVQRSVEEAPIGVLPFLSSWPCNERSATPSTLRRRTA